jgi:[ribosomal protein S18]-alanine N-acetyltransferase
MIRRARPADALRVAALEEANLGPDAWPFAFVAEGVAGEVPTTQWWVAEREGRLLGHAVVSVVADVAELQRISVVAAARRTGVGGDLLRAVLAVSAAEGAARVLLEVREDNEAARAFYAAHGFTELDRRPRYYADGATAVVLERAPL